MMGLITFLSIFLVGLMTAILSLPIAPVLDAQTVEESQSITHMRPIWEQDRTILVPANTRILPLRETERKGVRYLKSRSEYGVIHVPINKVRISLLSVPYKTRLGWVLGWNLQESDGLRVCFQGDCYNWVRSYQGSLGDNQYISVWRYLGSGWILMFMALSAVRFGRYDMTSSSHTKATIGVLAMLISMGLANLGLWMLLLTDHVSFMSALAGVGANVFCMGLLTIRCRDQSEETIRHRTASIFVATVGMTGLGWYVGSSQAIWETVLLVSPVGVLYAALEVALSRMVFES